MPGRPRSFAAALVALVMPTLDACQSPPPPAPRFPVLALPAPPAASGAPRVKKRAVASSCSSAALTAERKQSLFRQFASEQQDPVQDADAGVDTGVSPQACPKAAP